jgi:hypothetical protein
MKRNKIKNMWELIFIPCIFIFYAYFLIFSEPDQYLQNFNIVLSKI